MSRIRSWLPVVCVFLLAALAVQPLIGALPKGHDTLLHFYRIPELNALWSQGFLYARWAPNLVYGYGYPLPIFYPPLAPYLMTGFYWVTFQNAVLATSLSFTLAVIIGCLGMYLLGNSLYHRWGGFLTAAAYTLAPHYLYQTYERGSISTSLVMAFYPWALWAMMQVGRKPTLKRVALAALAILFVFASHTSASLLYLPIPLLLGLLVALVSGANRRERWHKLVAVLAALVLGLALSAWIWLPSTLEAGLTQYSHFVSASKELYLTTFADIWRWPGVVIAGEINPPLPQSPGLMQMVLAAIATVLAVLTLIRKRMAHETPALAAWIALGSAGLGFVFAFFATRYSLFFWQHLPLMYNIQYPWRFLDQATFCLALACGSLVVGVRLRFFQIILIAVSSLILTANALPYLYPPRWVQLPLQPTLADATSAQHKYGILGLTSWGEYLPATADFHLDQPAFRGADAGASLAAKLDRSNLQLNAVSDLGSNSLRANLEITFTTAASLTFSTFYFPGWRATLDGAALPVRADASGLITLDVPAGKHHLALTFGETPLRLASDILSGVALAGVLAALLLRSKRKAKSLEYTQQKPEGYPFMTWLLPGVMLTLVISKVAYFDRIDSPLVLHESSGRLPSITAAVYPASPEINLIGSIFENANLTLYWQALTSTQINYSVEITLIDKLGTVGALVERQHPGFYPTSYWESGQLVRDDYNLPLKDLAHSGTYQVLVLLRTPTSSTLTASEPITINVGTIFVPPSVITDRLRVVFGDVIALDNTQIPTTVPANGLVTLTLDWRTLDKLDGDYTVFIHLLNLDGSLAIAGDAAPLQSNYPTSLWEKAQTFRDVHSFYAPAKPGMYEVEIGWYLASSGKRLTPQGPGTTNTSSVILGPIEVTEPIK